MAVVRLADAVFLSTLVAHLPILRSMLMIMSTMSALNHRCEMLIPVSVGRVCI